jgi:catechol 2,3-dioxygenase-like lactoylglutathione lyase family enzyme
MSAAPQLRRLTRFSLNTADISGLTDFYRQAFGCTLLGVEDWRGAGFEAALGMVGGARRALLALGEERIELLEFDVAGASYPAEVAASDLRFQHCALVVADIGAAFRQLSRMTGWRAISIGGPQRLPPNTGGVSAFKFRDPEGHPLELLAFASERVPQKWRRRSAHALCWGIDHSAITVADSARSIAFYESLGLEVIGSSHNHGPEQARLDGLSAPEVEVTALAPSAGGPHVELLCYRGAADDSADRSCAAQSQSRPLRINDIAATRLVFQCASEANASAEGRTLTDPDGHRLLLLSDQNG